MINTAPISPVAGLEVRPVGDEAVAIVPGASDVRLLDASAAQVLQALQAGDSAEPTAAAAAEMVRLLDAGLAVEGGMSRRQLLARAGLVGGAAIVLPVALAMPAAAAGSPTAAPTAVATSGTCSAASNNTFSDSVTVNFAGFPSNNTQTTSITFMDANGGTTTTPTQTFFGSSTSQTFVLSPVNPGQMTITVTTVGSGTSGRTRMFPQTITGC